MSATEIYAWWFIWLAFGAVIVAAAAILLLLVIGQAHRIARLAGTALEVVDDIDTNTRVLSELVQTNKLARGLSAETEVVQANTQALASALTRAA